MATNKNNTIREIDNGKGYFNLTMDDFPDGTVDNPVDLLLRADNGTDISRLLFFIRSPGLIGGDEHLQWAACADPIAVEAIKYYHAHHQNREWIAHRHPSTRGTQRHINMAILAECYGEVIREDGTYFVSNMEHAHEFLSLVDRGANGGICGDDMTLISYTGRTIDVQGIDNHELPQLKLCSCGGTVRTQRGTAILIFNQYAFHGRGKSIHSSLQMEDNKIQVNDRCSVNQGHQSLITVDGYAIPLDFRNGLAYLNIRPFTKDEWSELPHVIMTRDVLWRPSKYDSRPSRNESWFDDQNNPYPLHPGFDFSGDLIETNISETLTPSILSQLRRDGPILENLNACIHETTPVPIDAEANRRFFLNQPTRVVRHTLDSTTQYVPSMPSQREIRDTQRNQYPANNVNRRHEGVATDTIYCDVTAWGGHTAAQIFAGKQSKYISVAGCSTDADFARTLNDEIRKRGAMDTLISDRAQAEVSERVKDILRTFVIKDWQSEPHHQQQNYSERAYQDVKRHTNWVMNWSGCPLEAWLHVVEYVIFIMNRTARKGLGWRTPYEALCGQTPDISVLMHFVFWEKCIIKNYQTDGKNFPSQSNELVVRFVGYSTSVGHSLTFKVYNEETRSLLYRSCVKKITNELDINRKAGCDDDDLPDINDDDDLPDINDSSTPERVRFGSDNTGKFAGFDPEKIIGKSILMPTGEDGTINRGKVTDYMEEYEGQLEKDPDRTKFKVEVGPEKFEEFVAWNEICNFIEEQSQNDNNTWNFRNILDHRDMGKGRRNFRASKGGRLADHQVLIEWESGERSWEPISEIYRTAPHHLADYAMQHDLIDKWECKSIKIRTLAEKSKMMLRLVQRTKLTSHAATPTYMYGVQVPRSHRDAMEMDTKNDNELWSTSERVELGQLEEYEVFEDLGHKSDPTARAPEGYKRIPYHMVFAVKHDGRRKSRLVAGGHLTEVPTESVYSSVVSLRGVRIVIFLAELNELKIWQTDVGNAYLEAKTDEKVYVIAGPEFGEKEGHVFVIKKALYGLKSSGLRWHERFADILRSMKFFPCKAEPDIWIRDMDDHYEYIAVYTDDLTIASRNPQSIIDVLEAKPNNLKLKGTGELEFLLGCDYLREDDGTLMMVPKRYVVRMVDTYERLFGEKPKQIYRSPLEPNDRPELDTTELLDAERIRIYQSLIGSAQWIVQLGRFDISVHIMTLSSFRIAPRVGHLNRIKRIISYLSRFRSGAIRIRTDKPDLSAYTTLEYDWSNSPYAGAREEVPSNVPIPKGKSIKMWTFADANLMHDALSGKAVTAILHFFNKTPIDWYSKRQNTVNTATYGAEGDAARTAIEQIRSNKLTLMYLGVPIDGPALLLGDNKTIVENTTTPHGKLHKRHLMLSYHYVREAVASGSYKYAFVNGKDNLSDVLSKHWAHNDVWHLLQAVLFLPNPKSRSEEETSEPESPHG